MRSRKQEIAIILSKYRRKGAHSSVARFDANTAKALVETGSVVVDRHTRSGGQGQGMNWIRQEKRLALYLRDNMTCAWCTTKVTDGVKLTLDHVIPHSQGGTNNEKNLVTTCLTCNSKRGNRSVVDFAKSLSSYLGTNASDIIKRVRSTIRKKIDVPAAKVLQARLRSLGEHATSFAMSTPAGGLRNAINARKAEGHRASDERTVWRAQDSKISIEKGFEPQLHQSSLEAEGHRSLNRQVHTGSRRVATMHGNMLHKVALVDAADANDLLKTHNIETMGPVTPAPINLYKIRVPKKSVVTRTAKYYRGDLHKTSLHQEPDVPIYGPEYLSVTTIPRKKIRKVGTI